MFIKSPVKRNGIHSGGYSRIVRDTPVKEAASCASYAGESPGRLALVLEINPAIRLANETGSR